LINTARSRVYALFDDSSADEVIFTYYGAPISQNIPIRAFSNDIEDPDVQHSVMDGASAALANYEKNFKPIGERYCFAYKFINDHTNRAITGRSAGLAFCIKFALKLYKNIIKKELKFSVAATGVIDIDEDDAHIRAVKKINSKFEAALNCLKPGDLFLYPLENESQIKDELKHKISEKGIYTRAVENVGQALKILFEGYIGRSEISQSTILKRHKYTLAAAIFMIIFIFLYVIFSNDEIPCYEEALNNLESGEVIKAKAVSENCLEKTGSDSIQILLARINSELKVSSNFIYIKDKNTALQDAVGNSPLLLGVDDGYRFEMQSGEDCYLYIFQFDSETSMEKLFPLSAFILNQHFLTKNDVIRIPGGENMFYLNDKNHHGTITIYIIAAPWRLKDLEDIYNNYEDNGSRPGKRKIRNEMIERINHYSVFKKSDLNCVFLKEFTFIQE